MLRGPESLAKTDGDPKQLVHFCQDSVEGNDYPSINTDFFEKLSDFVNENFVLFWFTKTL